MCLRLGSLELCRTCCPGFGPPLYHGHIYHVRALGLLHLGECCSVHEHRAEDNCTSAILTATACIHPARSPPSGIINMKQDTAESEAVENHTTAEDVPPPKPGAPLMRSKEDEIPIWQSIRRHKLVGLIAMAAAFCAALDGYRKAFLV